ncbi:translation initiation factor IF-2 [Alicyclobacillus ferrooxydans]
MSSKEILTILSRLDVPVANHMSVMDNEMVTKVEQFFNDVKKRAAQKHATEVERELREKQRSRERASRQNNNNRGEERPASNANAGAGSSSDARPPRRDDRRDDRKSAAAASVSGAGATSSASVSPRLDASSDELGKTNTGRTADDKPSAPVAPVGGETTSQSTAAQQDSASRPDSHSEERPARNSRPFDGRRPSGAGESRPMSGDSRRSNYGNGQTSSGQRGGSGYDNRNRSGSDGRSGGDNRGGYQGRPDGGRSEGQNRGSSGSNAGGAPRTNDNRGGYSGGQNRSGYQGRPDGGQNRAGYQGRSDGGQRSGPGGRPQGGSGAGGYGGRPQGGGGSGYGGRPQGGGGGGYGGRPQGGGGAGYGGRPQGGGRPGAGSGRGGMTASAAPVAKPVSPSSKAKEKERERNKSDFPRDRKEQFNEEKLQRSGGRRRGGGGGRSESRRPELPTHVTVEGAMSVGDFAKLLKREPSEVIKKLLFLGIMATINQDIDTDAMELIAGEFGVTIEVTEPVDEEALDMLIEEDKEEDRKSRPPVVTIMGHVDHGKTTLLDAIRNSRVTATESGGITQHIGAYQVEVNGRAITFLDTPGHEAFTTMRARGAQVTDVTILVVAADDGVMPQTVEAINHAKAANVPIIIAVNKMDKPDANPDRVKQELTQYGLVSEDWGGETVFVNISALKHEGLEELLEMVLLVADMQEMKANPTGRPRGTVIEAKLDKGRGTVATVLVQNGTLKVGDIVVAGNTYGKVRAMVDDLGKRIKEAGPSTPVEIQGLNDVPSAGDLFVVYDDERSARNLVSKRVNREKAEQLQNTSRVTLDDLYRQIKEGNVKELNVIVKADVQGSVEALVQSIEKIDVEGVRVHVIHKGAGAINESDVSLASASNAIIIGFHVRPDVNAKRAAEAEKVDIRLYRVIYNVTEELESAMKGMLDPEYKEVVLGHAEVRNTFKISRIGTVAGCYVVDGKVARDAECRVVRDGIVVYEGMFDSLKRFKDDAREVATGFECGITLEKFNDIKVGDVIEAFKMEAIKVQ